MLPVKCEASMLAILCTQHLRWRVRGNTSSRAYKPRAPPTARTGARMLRRAQSRSRSAQGSEDSRRPSVIAISSSGPHPDTAPSAARKAVAAALAHPLGANLVAGFYAITCGDTPLDAQPCLLNRQECRGRTAPSLRRGALRGRAAGPPRPARLPAGDRHRRRRPGQFENGNACVDALVGNCFLTGTAPAVDTTCRADRLPVGVGSGVSGSNLRTAGVFRPRGVASRIGPTAGSLPRRWQ